MRFTGLYEDRHVVSKGSLWQAEEARNHQGSCTRPEMLLLDESFAVSTFGTE